MPLCVCGPTFVYVCVCMDLICVCMDLVCLCGCMDLHVHMYFDPYVQACISKSECFQPTYKAPWRLGIQAQDVRWHWAGLGPTQAVVDLGWAMMLGPPTQPTGAVKAQASPSGSSLVSVGGSQHPRQAFPTPTATCLG